MTLFDKAVRPVLSASCLVLAALTIAAVPAAASSCQTVYNNCMKSANNAYNQCVSNVEGSCDIWSYGSYAYMYCEDSISEIIYEDCGTTWDMVQSQCQTAYDNCLSGTGKLVDPGDSFLDKPLPPAKLPTAFWQSRRRSGSSSL